MTKPKPRSDKASAWNNKPWSGDEDQMLIDLFKQGLDIADIAARLGRQAEASRQRVVQLRRWLGAATVPYRHKPGTHWSEAECHKLKALYRSGALVAQIASNLGLAESTVFRQIERLAARGELVKRDKPRGQWLQEIDAIPDAVIDRQDRQVSSAVLKGADALGAALAASGRRYEDHPRAAKPRDVLPAMALPVAMRTLGGVASGQL